MPRHFILAAALAAFTGAGAMAGAAPLDSPYALRAQHADFEAGLDRIARQAGEVGDAARVAAGLMAAHNAAQERLVLPLLGLADGVATSRRDIAVTMPGQAVLADEIARLYAGDVAVVTALADLQATAETAGEAQTARLAERMIWHETTDVEVLYPAALLVGATMQARAAGSEPATFGIGPQPLYGEHPVPMMGVGDPHAVGE